MSLAGVFTNRWDFVVGILPRRFDIHDRTISAYRTQSRCPPVLTSEDACQMNGVTEMHYLYSDFTPSVSDFKNVVSIIPIKYRILVQFPFVVLKFSNDFTYLIPNTCRDE